MEKKNEAIIIRQIPPDLKRRFKAKAAAEGKSMQAAIIELMAAYVEGAE